MSIHITCNTHPKYKAIKAPTSLCQTCHAMWAARQHIENNSTQWEFRYMPRPSRREERKTA